MTKPPYDYEELKDWVMNHPLEAAEWIADHRVGGEPLHPDHERLMARFRLPDGDIVRAE